MARGTTLGQLVVMFREEVGDATSAALGQNNLPHVKRLLRRTQNFLWNDFAWPHLEVKVEKLMQAGERFYSFPVDGQLDFMRASTRVEIRQDDRWRPVDYGITGEHYNAVDPELDVRDDPVRRWNVYQDDQFEVWPLPATNGLRMRFTGTRLLRPLVADTDVADLDDDLIVLFAAVEQLGRRDAKDAKAKENIATRLYNRLKGQQTANKGGMIVMGGGSDPRQNAGAIRPRPLYGRKI